MLSGSLLTRETFTGAWKAFGSEVSRLNYKADLVQLCGYYQYRPAFKATMHLECSTKDYHKYWPCLARVVGGDGVAEIMEDGNASRVWELPEQELSGFLTWMRLLGYEVRNSNTNPQIPRGSVLVPYSFPTLTPQSVQLRKSLETKKDA